MYKRIKKTNFIPVIMAAAAALFAVSCSSTETVPMKCADMHVLVEGQCYRQCVVASDCEATGFACVKNVCVFKGVPDGDEIEKEEAVEELPTNCLLDAECPAGHFCNDQGSCQTAPAADGDDEEAESGVCVFDADCEAGKYCKDDGTCRDKPTPDGDETEADKIEVELNPQDPIISVSPAEIDFGSVAANQSASRSVQIVNMGEADLIITKVSLSVDSSNTDFDFFTAQPLPYTIASGKNLVVTINYHPSADQSYHINLIIESNDPAQNPYYVSVYTTFKRMPRIEVNPTAVDFGLRGATGIYRETLTIRNAGKAPLSINDFLFTGTGEIFAVEEVPAGLSPANPHSLDPNEELKIKVVFKPKEQIDYADTLNIMSDDPTKPIFPVQLNGKGGVADIQVTPLNLDFTGIAAGSSGTRSVEIKNVGLAKLENIEIKFGQNTSPKFGYLQPPPEGKVLATDESFTVDIVYSPTSQDPDDGSLIIKSNDPDSPLVTVLFNAAGTPPQISVNPPQVHFGRAYPQVPTIGQVVWISNQGQGVLLITDYKLETGVSVIKIESGPEEGALIRQGESKAIHLSYAPTDASASNDVLIITSNDPVTPVVNVPLDGGGLHENQCPVADAGTGYQVEPLQTITLDGSNSSDPDGYIVQYKWSIEQKPGGSRSELMPPTSPTPRFFFDLAGRYIFKLTVTDNAFTDSCQESIVEFNAIPKEKLHIQLVWNTDDIDLDLHLIKPAGNYWNLSDDCFYKTCIPAESNPLPLNWATYGHPTLDIDDSNGYGPENININDLSMGTYNVKVFYYDSHDFPNPATAATVRVYVYGVQKQEFTANFVKEHQLWDVCDIQWTGNGANLVQTNIIVQDNSHGR